MKRFLALILIGSVLLCGLCGCSCNKESDLMIDYVSLCDYTKLNVPVEEYLVSDEDLQTAIQINLSSLDIEASEITDDIAKKYFGVANAETAKLEIKKEIVENRYFEAAQNLIFESSEILEFPSYCEEYVEKLVSMHKDCAKAEGVSYTEYFQKVFEMTESEYREAALWGYADFMILKAIAEKENYHITDEERAEIIEYTAKIDGIPVKEVTEVYGEEYFDYLLYEKFLKSFVLKTYNKNICEVLEM